MVKFVSKPIFSFLGGLSLLLGLLGIFLPILPTTPFILLAAFFFSKGSEKMHSWLLSRPHLGTLIQEWENHGVIRPRAKVISTIMIVFIFSLTLIYVKVSSTIKIIIALIGIIVLAFILTRPSKEIKGKIQK
jgi:uncharacterized protein